jgi:hypothetical protein
MIILNQHMTVRSGFSSSVFSEASIDCYIGSPPLAVILRGLACIMIKRPKSTIREPFIIITDLFTRKMKGNVIKPIMLERQAIRFSASRPTDPYTFIFT